VKTQTEQYKDKTTPQALHYHHTSHYEMPQS